MKLKDVTLDEFISELIRGRRSRYEVLREVWRDVREGRIRLEDPDPPPTFVSYVLRLDHSLWFWTSLTLMVLTCVLVYVTDYLPMLLPLRYVLGTMYVLFLPGYSLVEVLYPRERDLTPLERLALSVGLSLAVIPLIGLLLNYTPWGIRLSPVIVSSTLFTSAMLTIALYRKYLISKLEVRLTEWGR